MVDWYDFEILWVGFVGRINLCGKKCQEMNWLCLDKVQDRGGCREKPEIDAEIVWDVMKKYDAVGYKWRC